MRLMTYINQSGNWRLQSNPPELSSGSDLFEESIVLLSRL